MLKYIFFFLIKNVFLNTIQTSFIWDIRTWSVSSAQWQEWKTCDFKLSAWIDY